MIDAEKLFGSSLADRERWDARRKAAFEAGVSALPPDASAVLLASRTDYETGRNLWELALTRFNGGRDVATVAIGADIAGGLRDAQSSLRGVGMRTSVRTMSSNNGSGGSGPAVVYGGYSDGYGYGYGGYSYRYFDLRSGARAQDQANAAIRMEERVSGVANVQSIWKNIDEATAMIRREMT